MGVITKLPEGLKKLAFEKNHLNLIGGLPPVCFVTYLPKKHAGESPSLSPRIMNQVSDGS